MEFRPNVLVLNLIYHLRSYLLIANSIKNFPILESPEWPNLYSVGFTGLGPPIPSDWGEFARPSNPGVERTSEMPSVPLDWWPS